MTLIKIVMTVFHNFNIKIYTKSMHTNVYEIN